MINHRKKKQQKRKNKEKNHKFVTFTLMYNITLMVLFYDQSLRIVCSVKKREASIKPASTSINFYEVKSDIRNPLSLLAHNQITTSGGFS